MFIGRLILGQELVLTLMSRDANSVATKPDVPPCFAVYNAAGTKVQSGQMATLDRYGTTGLFRFRLALGSAFVAGKYMASLSWKIGGVGRTKTAQFEVVGGGDAAGAVVSQYWLERPQASYLVQMTDGGVRVFGRNPGL